MKQAQFKKSDIEKINSVSPSFCLAKWKQVTIDIVHGTTHSCHHPERHHVPVSEIEANPSALHNTNYKKKMRQLMLNGIRPEECKYCWDVEDSGSEVSDRIIKSLDHWAHPHLNDVIQAPWDANVLPSYMEVMIDDACQFSCAYCMADVSTSIAMEMKTFGPYAVRDSVHRMPRSSATSSGTENPFEVAFWKWLPEVLPQLEVLRVTGGEPVLSPKLNLLFDFLRDHPNEHLTLVINTNLGYSEKTLHHLVDRLKQLIQIKAIAKVEFYTSVETFGQQAEFIRSGLKYQQFISNISAVHRHFSLGSIPVKIVIMCTFNALSAGQFHLLIEDVVDLKSLGIDLIIDISYLKNPSYLSAEILTPDLKDRVSGFYQIISDEYENIFSPHERLKMKNLIQWLNCQPEKKLVAEKRADFYKFVNEYSRRKNLNFRKIFPEFTEFMTRCKREGLNRLIEAQL